MDLVSSTLNKYLRHRFNGATPKQMLNQPPQPQPAPPALSATATTTTTTTSETATTATSDSTEVTPAKPQDSLCTNTNTQEGTVETHNNDNGQETESASHDDINDTISDICDPIEIHSLLFRKILPCCVALHNDLTFIAAGFENSHIYLWTVVRDESYDLDEERYPSGGHQLATSGTSTQEQSGMLDAKMTHATEPCLDSSKLKLGDMFRLLAHSGPVYSIEFIQENDLMLSCSEDTTIRLWCLKTKCNIIIYRGHNYPIWSMAVSPHGDYFASASMDTTARLWSFDKMCPLRIFCGHEGDVECVKFHPNAKYIATGSTDSTVRLWNISDGRMVRLMVGHKSPITSLSFLPNGKFLASSSSDGSIKVWDLTTNLITIDLSVPAPCSISFSPLLEFASTCGGDNVLRIWNFGVTKIVHRRQHDFGDKFTKIIQTHFLRDNKLFIVGFTDTHQAARQEADDTPMTH